MFYVSSENDATFLRFEAGALLECGAARALWVRWEDTAVQLGQGNEVGVGKVLDYNFISTSEPPNFSNVSIATGHGGNWSIQGICPGEVIYIV